MKTSLPILGLLTGCHVGTLSHVQNLEVPRVSDNTYVMEAAPASVARPVQKHVRVLANHVDRKVELASAHVRPVQGSTCHVSSPTICSENGQCQVGISVEGDVCVLLVRGVSTVGHELDSYCHDLSHPEGSDLLASAESKGHPAWERCVDDARPGRTVL